MEARSRRAGHYLTERDVDQQYEDILNERIHSNLVRRRNESISTARRQHRDSSLTFNRENETVHHSRSRSPALRSLYDYSHRRDRQEQRHDSPPIARQRQGIHKVRRSPSLSPDSCSSKQTRRLYPSSSQNTSSRGNQGGSFSLTAERLRRRESELQNAGPSSSSNGRNEKSRPYKRLAPSTVSKAAFCTPQKFFKTKVILLATNDKRTTLEPDEIDFYNKHGLVMSLVELDKSWSEDEVKFFLADTFFPHLLGNPITFLKADKTKLYPIALGSGLTASTKTLAFIYKQAPIYLQPEFDLDIVSEMNEELEQKNEGNRRNTYSSTSSVASDHSDSYPPGYHEFSPPPPDFLHNEPSANEEGFNVDGSVEGNENRHDDSPVLLNDVAENESDAVLSGQNSPESSVRNIVSESAPSSLQELISALRRQVGSSTVEWEIDRNQLLETATPYLSDPETAKKQIKIRFKDEEGVDNDGLKKDFFQSAFNAMKESDIFYGTNNQKYLSRNRKMIRSNMFFSFGALCALSFVHGGPTPNFLSTYLQDVILTGSGKLTVTQIQFQQAQEDIIELSLAQTMNEVNIILERSQALAISGAPHKLDSINDNMAYVELIVKDGIEFYAMNKESEQQFLQGLDVLGVLSRMRQHPDWIRPLLQNNYPPLDAHSFLEKFVVERSTIGSIAYTRESRALRLFEDMLISLQGRDKAIFIEDILSWVTGMEREPPTGFTQKPSIGFLHSELGNPLPDAMNCNLRLLLPIVYSTRSELPKFTQMFVYAVKNRQFMKH